MSDLFRMQAIDAISRRYGSPLKIDGGSFWRTTGLLAVLSVAAVSAIMFVNYERWETQAGITVLEQPPVIVSAPYRSVVRRVLVTEGQLVSVGDPLLELGVAGLSDGADDPVARQRQEFEKLLVARKEADRFVQENGRNAISLADSKVANLKSQIAGVQTDLERHRAEMLRLEEFINRLKEPRFADVLPKAQILDYESRYTSAASAVSAMERQLLQLRAEVISTDEAKGKVLTDLALSRSQAEEYAGQHEVDRLNNVMEKGGVVYASSSGVVSNILVRPSSEIDSEEPMLSIVDAASPVVGVIMATGDQAAFLEIGDVVNLRFESWSYRTKGEVPAQVRELSRVPVHLTRQQLRGSGEVRPLYRVTLQIAAEDFRRVSDGRALIAGLGFDGVILKGGSPLIDIVIPQWRLKEAEA